MPVRNIGAIGVKNRDRDKPIPIHVPIPPLYDAVYKIEVISDGTTYDITLDLIEGKYTDGITDTIGDFEFKIQNGGEDYTDIFSVYDEVRVYLDYGSSADNQRFTGYIERVSRSNNNIVLSGKGGAIKVMGKKVIYSATSKARSTILAEIISENFSDILTTNNLESDTGTATVSYSEKPFWEIVQELCRQGGYDAYIDKDLDFNYFESGSRKTTTESIVHDRNLIETGDFAPDAEGIYNKVRVYGKEYNGIPIIATAKDSTSISTYGPKELKINDSNITTQSQAQARADFELSSSQNPPTVGTLKSLCLPTLAPGEQLPISDPMNGLEPGYYSIQKFTHTFSNDDPLMTEVTIQQERSSIPTIMKKRIKFESEITAITNLNDMDYTILYNFNSDIGSNSNTTITKTNPDPNTGEFQDGYLAISEGSSVGTWTSATTTLDSNVDSVEMRISGDNIGVDSMSGWVSTDGGTTWTEATRTQGISVPSGKRLAIKLELFDTDTKINTVALLYKLE